MEWIIHGRGPAVIGLVNSTAGSLIENQGNYLRYTAFKLWDAIADILNMNCQQVK